jgi:hypothetical protein
MKAAVFADEPGHTTWRLVGVEAFGGLLRPAGEMVGDVDVAAPGPVPLPVDVESGTAGVWDAHLGHELPLSERGEGPPKRSLSTSCGVAGVSLRGCS